MRALSLFAVCGLAACVAVPTGGSGPGQVLGVGGEQTSSGGGMAGGELPVVDRLGHEGFAILLNDERAEGGVSMVQEDARLSGAALGHARDMVDRGYLAHVSPEGATPGDRALAAGYDWNFIAENIAQGFHSDPAVIAAWMDSPGHRANMLDARAEEFGLGRVGSTWVLLLGREFD